MAEVAQKVITWQDYLAGEPKDLTCYEIVDGEVIPVAAPSIEHQWVVKTLLRLLDDSVTPNQLGVVLPAPVDVVVQQEPVRTRQPDLLFLRKERGGTPENIRQLKRLDLDMPPDLVVEIVSPSEEEARRLTEKLADYHRIGVFEIWLVHLEERAMEVLVRSEEGWRWHGFFFGKEKIRSPLLGETDFLVEQIFA
ncbi:MAG: hypothetical protein IMHGJWDQ_001661 [Candidatus Fervidibacter sp.]